MVQSHRAHAAPATSSAGTLSRGYYRAASDEVSVAARKLRIATLIARVAAAEGSRLRALAER